MTVYLETKTRIDKTKKMSHTDVNPLCEIDAQIAALCALINTFAQWCSNCQIDHQASEMFSIIGNIVELLEETQTMIIARLDQWKCEQHRTANQFPTPFESKTSNNDLDRLQNWFNKLFAGIISMCEIIDIVCITYDSKKNSDAKEFEVLRSRVLCLQRKLIGSCLVIEKQPPQVIQKDARFGATVRMLITNFGNTSTRPHVSVSILSESKALKQMKQSMPLSSASGSISQNIVQFEMEKSALKCNLNKMMITKVKRANNGKPMTDQKYVLSFQANFQLDDTHFDIWQLSLPIVVVVFGYQEPQAWANITWGNAFAENDRNPFSAVDSVTWSKLAAVLNTKFESYVGSPLTYEDFRYLYGKFFGTTEIKADASISLAQFCKNPLPDRKFTFWDWFYAVIKLTRDHLREPWMEGLVTGFISRKNTEERLINCPPGTFLLRYSDSYLGGISLAWVELQSDGKPKIAMLQPFTHEDFRYGQNLIGDLIERRDECTHLYPNIPKEQAFQRYCSKRRRHVYSTHMWRRRW